MKKLLFVALLVFASLALMGPSEADASDITLPDGTECDWVFDQHNSYGGWAGRYACTTTDGYSYLGWGPASNPPPSIEP